MARHRLRGRHRQAVSACRLDGNIYFQITRNRWRKCTRGKYNLFGFMDQRALLIGVSARIYTPGTPGVNVSGIWSKNLHYLEQSVAHWVLSGHAMAVMIPAVTRDSIVMRTDLDLDDYAATLDGLVLQGGNDVAPECYGEQQLDPAWAGDAIRDRYEIELLDAFIEASLKQGV